LLINCDVKGLEVVCAAQLSGDATLSKEIIDGEDIHGNNQQAFGLGEGKAGRLIAKIFKFRLIYGGSAYSYANDPDFISVSRSQEFWQDVIDKYYTKYKGIRKWHDQLVIEAQTTGRLLIPSGRYFPITPDFTKRQPWPLPVIKNYPVSGFGADLVMLARLRAKQLLQEAGIEALMVSTVHDSIVVDTPSKNIEIVAKILFRAVQEVPRMVKEIWKYNFVLPLTSELQIGMNKKEMVDFKV
jgi:DNA polymerase I-like protein with 3'-5' exonuclease and polymerase domains